jgi:non-specific serine/threonine protein kinase
VDKSILKRQLKADRLPRYWLLEMLRWYGRQRLREAGDEPTWQQRHFDWICGLARMVGACDASQPDMFRRMYWERDNLWTALEYCSGQPRQAAAGAEAAQHLWAYWACRGPFGDVRRVLISLAESAPEDSDARARLLWVAAMAASQSDYQACTALTEDSLRTGTTLRDVEAVTWSLLIGAMPRWIEENAAAAADNAESALSLARLMRIEQAELAALIRR